MQWSALAYRAHRMLREWREYDQLRVRLYCHKGVYSNFLQRSEVCFSIRRKLALLSETNNLQFKILSNFHLVIFFSKVLDEPISAYHCAQRLNYSFGNWLCLLCRREGLVSLPGVDLKLFQSKFTNTCKLYHFINISDMCGIFMKRTSLQNRVCKFTSKRLYEIDQRKVL